MALECGTPQGSPISPIISMLYFSPILQLNDPDRRFGYADDVAITAVGETTAETTKKLQWELEDTLKWGRENAISFDPEKAELIHFYYTRGQSHNDSIDFEGITIEPKASIRWLGVHLDSRLSFKTHVETMTSKALKAGNFLRSLNKAQKGSPPDAVALAAKACVVPVALYEADVWWPGETRASSSDASRTVSTRTQNLTDKINKALLQRTANLVGRTVRPSLFAKNNGAVLAGPNHRGLPKKKAAEKHIELLDNLPREVLLCYSDGSQDKAGNTGWGAVTYHDCRSTSACGYIPNAEVYDAEAVGAYEAMKLASIREVRLFLDNSAVVDGILGKTPDSSQRAYMGLRKIAKDLGPRVTTKVAWVPGHKDVFGNEQADKLAKAGSELPGRHCSTSTITHIRRWARKERGRL